MLFFVVVSILLFLPVSSSAQGFDCQKAQTRAERLICSDAGLRELDEHLGRYYEGALEAVAGAASCLRSDQAQWLKSARDACQDAACLKTTYLNRLAELDAFQPGANAISNIELPKVPTLVWVIAPAADTVTAPPKPGAKPLEAAGTLLDEVASGGDGFMLQTATGTRIPLVLLMFLDGETPQRLAMFAAQRGATFRARGFAAQDGDRTYFEPSRCTFIHRLPEAAAKQHAPGDPELEMEKVRTRVVSQGKVCPDPARPCPGFKANELSFAIAPPFKFDRGRDQSQPFYAVILKSGALCGFNDSERVQAQAKFPGAKVFLHRYMCEDFGDKVTYSNVNEKSGFVAVYAGEAEAGARKVLAQAKAAGYPDANLRRMEAIVVYQIE